MGGKSTFTMRATAKRCCST